MMRADARSFFSLPSYLLSRDPHSGKRIQHVLVASTSRALEDFGPRRRTRNFDSIGRKPLAPETIRSTWKQHSQLPLATASPRLQSSYITAFFRCPAHASQLPAYDLASPPRSAEQTVPVIAEKPSWSQTALSPDPASIGFIADFCRSQGDTRHFHSHKHHLRGYLHHEI